MGSGEDAGTQTPPAKRQRGTTKKSDCSSSLSFSVNSDDAERDKEDAKEMSAKRKANRAH